MIDFLAQRKNMVESQVRPSDITDRRVIRAMGQVPRELFVPDAARGIAYRDEAIALSAAKAGQPPRCLLDARSLAALIQSMDLGTRDRVLIIGAGCGYSAAVLSQIATTVVALESDAALAAKAGRALAQLATAKHDGGTADAAMPAAPTLVVAPLSAGHPAGAPYDAILIEGAVTEVSSTVLDQLKDGGRLVAVMVERGVGRATVWRRSGSTFASRAVRDMAAPLLPGFEAKTAFVF